MAYSQRDTRWASYPLGGGWTIGNSGCAITGACNIAMQYGKNMTPPQMVDALRAKGKDPASWQGSYLNLLFPDIIYKGFVGYYTLAQIDAAIAGDLRVEKRPGWEGLLKMDSNPNVAGIQLHFSRLRGVDAYGNVVIDDSWTGARTLVKSVYGDQRKAIWGCDFYYRAPIVVPPRVSPSSSISRSPSPSSSASQSLSQSASVSPSITDTDKEQHRAILWLTTTLNAIINFFKGLSPFK